MLQAAGSDDNNSNNKLIRQPFLLIRLVIFLILGFTNGSILVFSSWNVTAARNSGYVGPFGASLALFNSCAFLFFVFFAYADMLFPSATTSIVKFELGWTGVLSVFSFAASIVATRDGPNLMCQPGVNEDVCTSSFLLLPVTWLSSFMLFSYFIILMVLTTIHIQYYPNVHNIPIIHVPWFQPTEPLIYPTKPQELQVELFGNDGIDLEKQPQPQQRLAASPIAKADQWAKKRLTAFSVASFSPNWAKTRNHTVKRGVTNPFLLPIVRSGMDVPWVPPRLEVQEKITPIHAGAEERKEDSHRLSYWVGPEVQWKTTAPPEDAHPSYRVGEGLFEVDRNRVKSAFSDSTTASKKEEKRMGVQLSGEDRKSVSSMFPRYSARAEEWDRPVVLPPFKRGLGEGWRTASDGPAARQVRVRGMRI